MADIPLDSSWELNDVPGMATRKTVRSSTTPSKGTVLGTKYRARANSLTDAERQGHRSHAMSLIYLR